MTAEREVFSDSATLKGSPYMFVVLKATLNGSRCRFMALE